MDDLTLRCPRCKQTFTGNNPNLLADTVITHVEKEHGHAPPRDHVLARIERHNPPG
jgi:uncharacterized C2H2 Zn-finger protein